MLNNINFKNKGPWSERMIFAAKAGSHAYGTTTPESDLDIRGVFIADEKGILGLNRPETYTETEPVDLQMFELRHFIKLCLQGSPLPVEMLFYPLGVVLKDSMTWHELTGFRNAFLGKHLAKTLGGFAQGDIKRIQAGSTGKQGAKGKLLIEKYGYNTKQAATSYRLLRMSQHLFRTGELKVRPDPDVLAEIVAIKNGKYTKEQFLELAAVNDKHANDLAAISTLPDGPDRERVEDWLVYTYKRYLNDAR